jgi:protein-disulfide isomerase
MNLPARFWILILFLWSTAWTVEAQTPSVGPKDLCLSGQPSAPIRVDVFSDFQCPSCRGFYLETIKPLIKDYGKENKVCVRYFDFPLKMHKFAFEASRYSVAARRLGQDPWQKVCEALYEHQAKWTEDGKIEAAVADVLSAEEMSRLKKILKEPSIDQMINQELALATERQVTMTPTLFLLVNGREKKVNGKISYPILKEYLERMSK